MKLPRLRKHKAALGLAWKLEGTDFQSRVFFQRAPSTARTLPHINDHSPSIQTLQPIVVYSLPSNLLSSISSYCAISVNHRPHFFWVFEQLLFPAPLLPPSSTHNKQPDLKPQASPTFLLLPNLPTSSSSVYSSSHFLLQSITMVRKYNDNRRAKFRANAAQAAAADEVCYLWHH
jgi:hypothetical protein